MPEGACATVVRRLLLTVIAATAVLAPTPVCAEEQRDSWPQWRGPQRDGHHRGRRWPERLSPESLRLLWNEALGPSYSGPVVVGDRVYTTQTKDKKYEVVHAFDRRT
ncbi:MAG: hypothetical protein N2039_08180, partial [Gemmataceae bacterium]|nr:hypothetical protein [Gemmataceae bacterium]